MASLASVRSKLEKERSYATSKSKTDYEKAVSAVTTHYQTEKKQTRDLYSQKAKHAGSNFDKYAALAELDRKLRKLAEREYKELHGLERGYQRETKHAQARYDNRESSAQKDISIAASQAGTARQQLEAYGKQLSAVSGLPLGVKNGNIVVTLKSDKTGDEYIGDVKKLETTVINPQHYGKRLAAWKTTGEAQDKKGYKRITMAKRGVHGERLQLDLKLDASQKSWDYEKPTEIDVIVPLKLAMENPREYSRILSGLSQQFSGDEGAYNVKQTAGNPDEQLELIRAQLAAGIAAPSQPGGAARNFNPLHYGKRGFKKVFKR